TQRRRETPARQGGWCWIAIDNEMKENLARGANRTPPRLCVSALKPQCAKPDLRMNLILLFDDDFIDARRVRLVGRRHAYVRGVHRAALGDVLRVGRLTGRSGSGVISTLGAGELEMEVALERDPPAALPLTLILALPRPKVLRRVLQGVVSMGVK